MRWIELLQDVQKTRFEEANRIWCGLQRGMFSVRARRCAVCEDAKDKAVVSETALLV